MGSSTSRCKSAVIGGGLVELRLRCGPSSSPARDTVKRVYQPSFRGQIMTISSMQMHATHRMSGALGAPDSCGNLLPGVCDILIK
jgi:hypothetical protein